MEWVFAPIITNTTITIIIITGFFKIANLFVLLQPLLMMEGVRLTTTEERGMILKRTHRHTHTHKHTHTHTHTHSHPHTHTQTLFLSHTAQIENLCQQKSAFLPL